MPISDMVATLTCHGLLGILETRTDFWWLVHCFYNLSWSPLVGRSHQYMQHSGKFGYCNVLYTGFNSFVKYLGANARPLGRHVY